MKKLFALLPAVLMVLSLAACGSSKKSDKTDSEGSGLALNLAPEY